MMYKLMRNRRGEAPIIATVILMAISLFTMSLTLSFVQANLTRRNGENDFTMAKTFMKNIGLTIDDVAWHKGQMNTIQYSSQNAEIHLREGLIHYKIEVLKTGVGQVYRELNETRDRYLSVLLYDIPQSRYALDNNYFEEILPGAMTSIVQNSTTSPIARVFAIQTPARAGEENYISVGVAPLIRSVPFSITTASGGTENFLRLYLVDIQKGDLTTANPRYLTLTGGGANATVLTDVRSIKISVIYIEEAAGYDETFFHFPMTVQEIDLGPSGAEVELYFGMLRVGFLE
jgi:hypothetical protein